MQSVALRLLKKLMPLQLVRSNRWPALWYNRVDVPRNYPVIIPDRTHEDGTDCSGRTHYTTIFGLQFIAKFQKSRRIFLAVPRFVALRDIVLETLAQRRILVKHLGF
jgi:hypothetical protein